MALRNKLILLLFLFIFSSNVFSDQLIIEPDMGRAPILTAMNHAKSSIHLVMYGLTDEKCIEALIDVKNKNLQILLEKNPYKAEDENTLAIKLLQENNVPLYWPNPEFKLTHQKTFLFDHNKVLIMTFNLTHSTFTKERNFALLTTDQAIVDEIESVFEADKKHHHIAVNNPNLVWCPNNCRERIRSLIKNAKSSITIYAQDISDYSITGTLGTAARSGIRVQLLLSESANRIKNQKRFEYLQRAGVLIHFNKHYIIHAKVIIIDNQYALLGSINLTESSINDNRELSIITKDPRVIKELITTFREDWKN
jgi:phosphatidylserine/phosphatidylglycerophosphate/cardiolipin synthase-like enzyme